MKAQTVNYFNPSLSQVQWETGITGRQTPIFGRGDMKAVYLASGMSSVNAPKQIKKHNWDFQWLQPLGKSLGSSAPSANPNLCTTATPFLVPQWCYWGVPSPHHHSLLLYPFHPKTQDKLYLPGLFTALGSTGDQTLVTPLFLFPQSHLLLGLYVFWPAKKNISYSASKFWRRLS